MHDESDSTDRGVEDYLLFAIVSLSFVGAVGCVVLSSPGLAFTGAAISLLALGCFLR
jgi:hypothetical protein